MSYGPYRLGRLCVKGTLRLEYYQKRNRIAQIRKGLQLVTRQRPEI